MSFMMMLAMGSKKPDYVPQTYTRTFTSNGSFVVPVGVSTLNMTGRGAAGAPGAYTGDVQRSAAVTYLHGIDSATVYPSSGDISWDTVQSEAYGIGGSIATYPNGGSRTGSDYVYNPSTHTYLERTTSISWSNAIASSPYVTFSAGWKNSGAVQDGDYGIATVNWREYGTYTSPSTGASATGFGKVFPGGTGGPASDVPYANVPVTSGATYNVVVPAGGSITITWKV